MQTIRDINLENKKVILRVDYNVSIKDGKVVDNNRITSSLNTINYLREKNCKIILMSHLGKVKTKEDSETLTLLPVKDELSKLLNEEVKFSSELKGKELEKKINSLKEKEILLLENTRTLDYPDKLESNCDEELSKYWASLGDVFVLDAFASAHRAHASTYGISKYLPHVVGFLVEKEIKELDKIKEEKKVLVLGGVKVNDKIGVIKNLIPTSDKVLVGGAMCASFLKSEGFEVGNTYVEDDYLNECKELINTNKIVFPIDVVTENGIKEAGSINKDESIFDIGPETIKLFEKMLKNKPLILMNGTMGKYEEEKYENGTKELFEFLKKDERKVVVCGGDAGAASKKYNFTPYYVSTGGGASLEYLEGKILPALEIMEA
ncbi:MAG: phosphoglycerate kinase [Tenericutes bacterium]|nr:phosphoglycerate kinase [Mycoplasmatota bacterium]